MIQRGLLIIICFCMKSALGCTSTSVQHKRRGDDVTIQFQARKTNTVNSELAVTNQILFDIRSLLTVVYTNGAVTVAPKCINCTFTGNAATGDLSIRLTNIQAAEGGTYKHSVIESSSQVKGCVTVYISGIPESPTIQADNNNIEGRNITLTCNSKSTTNPRDPGSSLLYKWKVNNTDIPKDERYIYSQSRHTLTITNLQKQDASKRFTCEATESGSGITLTSTSSNEYTIKVLYGPNSSATTLSPPTIIYTREENSNLGNIICTGDCNPACNYKWTKPINIAVSSNGILSLASLNRNEATTYTCTATNPQTAVTATKLVTVNVIYGPDANSIKLNTPEIAHTGNEGSAFTNITCNTDCYPACNYKWTKSGTSNAISSNGVLALGTLNRNESGVYTCTATNPRKSGSDTKQVTVNVRYGPDLHTTTLSPTQSTYTLEEGKILRDITCQGDCNPGCSYRWTKPENQQVASGDILSLGTLTRENAAVYTCVVTNTMTSSSVSQNVTVNVIYPPDVSILSSSKEYVEGKPLTLTCDAKGNPSTYNYNGFIQTFGGSIIHNGHWFVNDTLHIPSLQLQDTGNYTCYVNNGVKLPSGELKDSTNSTSVVVQVTPKILTDQLRFTGVTGNTAFVQVKLYSNPDIKKTTFVRYDGLTITDVSGSKYDIDIYKTVVEKKFYSTYVSLDGIFLNMSISNLEEDDFGNYTLVLENKIGTRNATIFLEAESAPSEPKNFVYFYEDNIHKFSWCGGFNGGHSQTFVIQTSIAGLDEWVNKTTVSEKDQNQYSADISYISPGTYIARIFAWNIEGLSEYVVLNETFTVEEDNFSNGDMSAVIGGIAGGSSALIVIILGIIVVVILKRRGTFSKGKAHAHDDKNDRKPVYEDENDYGIQDNPMYVSAGPRNHEHNAGGSGVGDAGAVYSTVDKKKLVVESSKSDVYAEVDKSKKTKKNKGDVYENATELKDRQKKNNKNDEIIYENPEPSKPAEKKNVNKDRLIYADLTFNDQPKGQKKLVIHGLDSMTEYVEVDFTKKADPLPESDDENNSPKK